MGVVWWCLNQCMLYGIYGGIGEIVGYRCCMRKGWCVESSEARLTIQTLCSICVQNAALCMIQLGQ